MHDRAKASGLAQYDDTLCVCQRRQEDAITGLSGRTTLMPASRTNLQSKLEDGLVKEHQELFAEIDRRIAAGEPAKALETLDEVVRSTGDFREARWLRMRLQAALDGAD